MYPPKIRKPNLWHLLGASIALLAFLVFPWLLGAYLFAR
jgi:hypothetical protein